MSLIEVNGIEYYYQVQGSGPTLLLLHGFTGSSASWQEFIMPFAKKFQVLLIDLPGHGRSTSPHAAERYTMELVSRDLVTIIKELKLSSANLLGYSMGGRLALFMALRKPEIIKSLILESSSPGLETTRSRRKRMDSDERLASEIEAIGVPAFVERWQGLPLFASQLKLSRERLNALRNQRLTNSASGLANSLRGMGTGRQPSLWPELYSIRMPVLVMAGELDGKYAKIARQIADAVTDAKLKIFPNAGHNIHLEMPQCYSTTVLDFLKGSR